MILDPLVIDAHVVIARTGATISHWLAIDFVPVRAVNQAVCPVLMIAAFVLVRSRLLFAILKDLRLPVIEVTLDGTVHVNHKLLKSKVDTLVREVNVFGKFPFTKGILYNCKVTARLLVRLGSGHVINGLSPITACDSVLLGPNVVGNGPVIRLLPTIYKLERFVCAAKLVGIDPVRRGRLYIANDHNHVLFAILVGICPFTRGIAPI